MGSNGNTGPCLNSADGQHTWANVTNSKGEVTGKVCNNCGATQ